MGTDHLRAMIGAKSFCELPKITWRGDDWAHEISEHELPAGRAGATVCGLT